MVVTDERRVPITVVGGVSLTCRRGNKNDAFINGTGQMVVTIGSCFAAGSKIGAILGGVRFTELSKDCVVGVITRCSSILGRLKNFVSSPLSSIKTIALGPISICFNARKRAQTLNGRGADLSESVTIGPWTRGSKTDGGLVDGEGDCLISSQTRMRTVTRTGHIESGTVDRRGDNTGQAVIGEVGAGLSTTRNRRCNVSGS
jgi:hypothetical protein